jgi:hypothetical protein
MRKKGERYAGDTRYNLARARKKSLAHAVNVLSWHYGVVVPKTWDEMTEGEQLAWARNRLRELAEGAENEKTQTIAAAALTRSLEPKASPKTSQDGANAPQTGKSDRSYLEALKAEIEARLEALDKGSS